MCVCVCVCVYIHIYARVHRCGSRGVGSVTRLQVGSTGSMFVGCVCNSSILRFLSVVEGTTVLAFLDRAACSWTAERERERQRETEREREREIH